MLCLFKEYMKLEPAEVQLYDGLIALPWSFKIFYGFLSDNILIFKSKRRGHILLNCACCIVAILSLIVFGSTMGKYFTIGCLFISQINMAYNDTVTDALTVQAAKKGIKDGCENLNSLSYLMQGFGAIMGAIISLIFSSTSKHVNPFACFSVYVGL